MINIPTFTHKSESYRKYVDQFREPMLKEMKDYCDLHYKNLNSFDIEDIQINIKIVLRNSNGIAIYFHDDDIEEEEELRTLLDDIYLNYIARVLQISEILNKYYGRSTQDLYFLKADLSEKIYEYENFIGQSIEDEFKSLYSKFMFIKMEND